MFSVVWCPTIEPAQPSHCHDGEQYLFGVLPEREHDPPYSAACEMLGLDWAQADGECGPRVVTSALTHRVKIASCA